MDTSELGRNIRQRRKAKRLTIADLAERLGVAARTLGSWERGETQGAWDHLHEVEDELGPVGGLPTDEPSITAALAQLRAAAAAVDVARDMLHQLQETRNPDGSETLRWVSREVSGVGAD